MRTHRSAHLIAGLAALGWLLSSPARAQVLDPIEYGLAKSSAFEYGCFGPCECPVFVSAPLEGRFTFYRTSVDPLFTHYALLNIAWSHTTGDPSPRVVNVNGHGTYDIGGEVALTQRMTLDLLISDPIHPPVQQHFDSGLVPVGLPFPAIDISVLSNPLGCHDSLFHVVAGPGGVLSVGPTGTRRMLANPQPNPSTGAVEVLFSPSSSGRARVQVVDLSGRVVASLLDGPLSAGQYRLRWNGRDERGAGVPPGFYWITAHVGALTERARIVRLQ